MDDVLVDDATDVEVPDLSDQEPMVGDVVQLGKYMGFIRKITKKDYVIRRIRKDQVGRIKLKE